MAEGYTVAICREPPGGWWPTQAPLQIQRDFDCPHDGRHVGRSSYNLSPWRAEYVVRGAA